MNLYDVIQVQKPKSVNLPKARSDSLHSKRTAYEQSMNLIADVMRNSKNENDERTVLRQAGTLLADQSNSEEINLFADFFNESGYLPTNAQATNLKFSLHGSGAAFTRNNETLRVIEKFNQSPRALLTDLLEISKIANMIIIPFEYLNPVSYESEGWRVKSAVNDFEFNARDRGMQVYVICPLRHYSILRHLQAADLNKSIIANSFQPNFDVLDMMMPAMVMFADRLTNIEGGISSLYSKIDTLDASMKGVVRGMESMSKKLDLLQAQVEKQQLELIASQTAIEEMKRVESARTEQRNREYAWFMAYEPLAFALPKGKTLADATFGYVGPCWGPDFDAIVAAALKLELRKGQRTKIESTIKTLWY